MSKNPQVESGRAPGAPACYPGKLYGAQRYADPQCYRGKAGRPPRFGAGDRVRVRDSLDMFYSQTPAYTRGVVGEVVEAVYESPAPEDEAWGYTDKVEWFYRVRFRRRDLWPEDGDGNPRDQVDVEIPERWLTPAAEGEPPAR